jgi:ADP-ribose pyrophosphatase YjhB (NUDIX family)
MAENSILSSMAPPHADAYRYCPRCATPLRPVAERAGDPPRPACERCGFVHYLDPKVAVGTIIRPSGDAASIVLVRRAIEPGLGLWVFPGGYVDRGERLQDAAVREAREECGLDVRLDALVNIYSYTGRTPVIIVYAATWQQGTLAHDEESFEARLFHRDEIPWSQLAFHSTSDALRDYFAGRRYPEAV